jgi:hypothetical protein
MHEPVVEPPQAFNRLEPGGSGSGSSSRRRRVPAWRLRGWAKLVRPGGHEEGLRRTRGEAAGEKLGATPVDRHMVNVGTALELPSCPAIQVGRGRARRQPMVWGRDGAAVVLGAGESPVQGEGRQRVSSRRTEQPGGHR